MSTMQATILRHPHTPMAVGLILTTLVHLCGMSWLTYWLIQIPLDGSGRLLTDQLKPLLAAPRPIPLGQDGPKSSAMAWIAYDDFRELIAPRSTTEQPALQRQIQPTPDAPLPPDPTPVLSEEVAAVQDAAGSVPSGAAVSSDPSSREQPPAPSRPTMARSNVPQKPLEIQELILGGKTTKIRSARRRHNPSRRRTASNPVDQRRTTHRHSRKANPTAAARSDKESSPVMLKDHAKVVVPGGVLVGEGLEVKTVQPRFSVITRASAVPDNPLARLVFNHQDGRVIHAKLIRSSGYPNVDGPVLASLYKWQATGQKLAQLGRPFEIRVELILMSY